MEIDITTLNDLSIFSEGKNQSVFDIYNYATTDKGKVYLQWLFLHPYNDLSKIADTQQALKYIITKGLPRPSSITNGTIMVIEKFFETPISNIPEHANVITSFLYRFLHLSDYGLMEYSVTHFIHFLKGIEQYIALFLKEGNSVLFNTILNKAAIILNDEKIKEIILIKDETKLNTTKVLRTAYFIQYRFKNKIKELIELYGQLDAYYSMAIAVQKHELVFPNCVNDDRPVFQATDLYHPLLQTPVAYNIDLQKPQQFLFLTGANMAGKSTFIKAVGIAAFLAQIGMGIPAKTCTLTLFDGLLSNIQIADNIVKGESYFFNEVQRIKQTILKINSHKRWFILIDELFKGTNVQDAMQCSLAVVRGLLKVKQSLFILSTHLYEIADELKQQQNIQFKFFETQIQQDQLFFNYVLKDGVSKDRIGYLILQQEKVVELLNQLS